METEKNEMLEDNMEVMKKLAAAKHSCAEHQAEKPKMKPRAPTVMATEGETTHEEEIVSSD